MKIKIHGFKALNGLKEPEGIELKDRVDVLTQYFFGGFGNNLTIIFLLVGNESRTKTMKNIFAWIKRKYEQIPFSELKKSPHYSNFKPLFEINELIPKLEKSIESSDTENVKSIIKHIARLGRDYADTVGEHYKELTGKSLSRENIETRALLEYRSKEQIQEQAKWLTEQGIEPNSFEKAAMSYYGVLEKTVK